MNARVKVVPAISRTVNGKQVVLDYEIVSNFNLSLKELRVELSRLLKQESDLPFFRLSEKVHSALRACDYTYASKTALEQVPFAIESDFYNALCRLLANEKVSSMEMAIDIFQSSDIHPHYLVFLPVSLNEYAA